MKTDFRAGLFISVMLVSMPAHSRELAIERVSLGSGMQNSSGFENASPVGDLGVWHAPQYLPGYPTAATLWPRIVRVDCLEDRCSGYTVTPGMGRGEYLFFQPARVSSSRPR